MKKFKIMIAAALMTVMGAIAADEITGLYKYEAFNTAPLIRVRYKGNADTATFTWAAEGYTIVEDSLTTSNAIENADTIATLVAEINAITNSSNKKLWEAFACAGLPADDIDSGDLTAASAAINCTDGKWKEVMTVDQSDFTYYDVCPWEWEQSPMNQIILKSVYGTPGQTGTRTIRVYVNSTEIWGSANVTNYPAGVFDTIDLRREFTADGAGLRIKRGNREGKSHVVIRSSATANADSGGLGVSYSMDK